MDDDGALQFWQQYQQFEEEENEGLSVHQAKVQSALAKSGIAKGRTCQQGASFKYRGIDEVYNALAPILSEHGLCILPRITSRECDERKSSKAARCS